MPEQPYNFDVEHAKMVERKRLRSIAKGDQRAAWEEGNWRRARFLEALGYEPPRATPEEIYAELSGEDDNNN